MAIPIQTQLFWTAVSRLNGISLLQLPPDQVRAASDRRRWLIGLPGAAHIVGRPHPEMYISEKTADGVRLRVYRPADSLDETLPLILNIHGGGFVAGDPQQSEWWCSSVSYDVRAVVVSVDYRLAPEHPFPAAPEDCHTALTWVAEHARDLGADGARIAVMGDSAGGNLAAVLCLMARDRGGPEIALQVLIYPSVDLVNSYPSEDENEFAPMLGKADLRAHSLYCPGEERNPYASPLFAEHRGLPPAIIQTANHDPLRDQGAAYATALRRAGVPVRLTNYVDAVHGYISIPGVVPAARQALTEAVDALRAALPRRPDFREHKALE
ncbi:MAG TPA: alpha/beta hydrolase [Jatrophihabitantaceae bacterium]